MSRAPNSSSNGSNDGKAAGPARLAGLVVDGDQAHLVIATSTRDGLTVQTASHAAADTAAIQSTLARNNVRLLVRVAPSGDSICRTIAPPTTDSEDRESLAGALSLAAESDLPDSLPAHRRAGGLIRLGPSAGRPVGLLTGWSGAPKSTPPRSGRRAAGGPIEVATTEPAALAAFLQLAGGVNAAASCNGDTASLIANGPTASVCRVVRVPTDPTLRSKAWDRAVLETSRAAGISDWSPQPPGGGHRALTSEPSLAGRTIAGSSRSAEWIGRYGLALGAVSLAASTDPASRALATLTEHAPAIRLPGLVRAATWLSKPARAWGLVAAVLLVLLFARLGIATARHSILNARAGGIASLQERLDKTNQQADFYLLLLQNRWPMTKLVADIASSAPVGVVVDSLEITQGGSGGVRLRGTASTADLVTTFRENLGMTNVFSSVSTPSIDVDGEYVEFLLDAKVATPLFSRAPIDDFATHTLFQRLYGDGATPSSDAGSATPDSGDGTSGSGRRRPRDADRSRTDEAAPATIPDPVTDEQIAAMDRKTAQAEYLARTKAANSASVSVDVAARLRDEAGRCKARMLAAIQENPGAATPPSPAKDEKPKEGESATPSSSGGGR